MPFAHKVISLIFLSHPSTFSSTKVDKVPGASSRKLLTKKNPPMNRNDANDDNNAAMTSESSSMKQKNYKTINRVFVSTHLQMTVVLWRNFLLNKFILTFYHLIMTSKLYLNDRLGVTLCKSGGHIVRGKSTG